MTNHIVEFPYIYVPFLTICQAFFNDFMNFMINDSEFDQSNGIQRKDEAEVDNNTHYISPEMITESKSTNSEVVSIHPAVKDVIPACRNPAVTVLMHILRICFWIFE